MLNVFQQYSSNYPQMWPTIHFLNLFNSRIFLQTKLWARIHIWTIFVKQMNNDQTERLFLLGNTMKLIYVKIHAWLIFGPCTSSEYSVEWLLEIVLYIF